jgi:hypothetical protein
MYAFFISFLGKRLSPRSPINPTRWIQTTSKYLFDLLFSNLYLYGLHFRPLAMVDTPTPMPKMKTLRTPISLEK